MLATVLGFLAADRLLWLGLASIRDRSGLRFSSLYRGDAACDLLVLGNSRGVGAVLAPRLAERIGRPVFNLSYNGMSPLVAAALLADFLDRHDPPKILLLEVSGVLSDHGLLHDLKFYGDRSDRLSALVQAHAPIPAYATMVSSLYRANGEMFLRSVHFRDRSDQDWMNRGIVDPALLERYVPAVRELVPATLPGNLDALSRITDACATHGITLIPFIAPYLSAYRDRITDWDAWLDGIRRSLPPDVPLLDLSQALSDPACFADPIHLNDRGSERLEEIIVAEIQRTGRGYPETGDRPTRPHD